MSSPPPFLRRAPIGGGHSRGPPLLGIVYAWEGGAVEVLTALEVSPRTRMLAFPARDHWAPEMTVECHRRKILWAHGEPDADQLAVVYQRLFLPFEETRVDFRRWAIELAREDAAARRCLPEHLLRVAEGAILHGLPAAARAAAHGVEGTSADKYVERVCATLGGSLDELRARYRGFVEGRGAPPAPLLGHPPRGAIETARRRPAARRARPPRPLSIESIDL